MFLAILPLVFMHTHKSIVIMLKPSTLKKMVGVKASEFSFKRKDQAITMRTKNGVQVDGEIVQFEPHGLFQKFAVAAERTVNIDPATIFKHELTAIPKNSC